MVKWISRYILSTVEVGQTIEQDKNLGQLIIYMDSDFASDLDKHR